MKCKCGNERFLSSYDKATRTRVAWICSYCGESIPVEKAKSKVTKNNNKAGKSLELNNEESEVQ